MTTEFKNVRKISEKADQLADSICKDSWECVSEQRHLSEGSRERAYWRYGYMVALRDVLRFLEDHEVGKRASGGPDEDAVRPAA